MCGHLLQLQKERAQSRIQPEGINSAVQYRFIPRAATLGRTTVCLNVISLDPGHETRSPALPRKTRLLTCSPEDGQHLCVKCLRWADRDPLDKLLISSGKARYPFSLLLGRTAWKISTPFISGRSGLLKVLSLFEAD